MIATREKKLVDQCSASKIERKVIYYPRYIFGIEFTVISLLARDNVLALHTENNFIDSFLGYLTFTYHYAIGKYTTDLERIKQLDQEYAYGANIYIQPKFILNYKNHKVLNELFTKEFFEYRHELLLSTSRLWYGRSTAKEAYEIISCFGFDGCKALLNAYMANPSMLKAGWPDLIAVKYNDFRFIEVKVGDRLNDNQVQNIIKLNRIFSGKVVVVQAFYDSVKASEMPTLGELLFGANEYDQ